MEILYFLIPLSLILGLTFLGLFIFAVKDNQFQDLETPAYRLLFSEKPLIKNKNKKIVTEKIHDE